MCSKVLMCLYIQVYQHIHAHETWHIVCMLICTYTPQDQEWERQPWRMWSRGIDERHDVASSLSSS